MLRHWEKYLKIKEKIFINIPKTHRMDNSFTDDVELIK